MVRPVAGVWESVDSRPVPPALSLFEGARFFFGVAAFVFAFTTFLGRLALEAAGRRFGADALLAARLTAFFFPFFAFRAGFLAI
jgi:hypothetical protein